MILGLNFLLCFRKFSKSDTAAKTFTVYCGLMLLIQIGSEVLARLNINNLFMSHFYFVIQFILLSFFYYQLMKEPIQKRLIILSSFVFLVLLIIQYAINPQLFFRFNTFEVFITSLPIIVYATFHLYNLLNEKKTYYFINLGILLYLFGSTVIFLTANLLMTFQSKLSFRFIFDLNIFLYVVYQLFVAYDLIKNPTTNTIQ